MEAIMNENTKRIYKRLHILSLFIGILTIVCPIIFWNKIPDQIPLHYNAAGVIDNWSDKTSLILLFFVVVMLMGIMSICVYFVKSSMESRYSSGDEKSEMQVVYPMIIIMNLVIQIMLAYIIFCCATCRPLGNLFLPIFLIGIFAPIIFMIYKCSKIQSVSGSEKAFYKKLEQEEHGVLYRSKVDWWLGLLLGGTELMMIWYTIEPIVSKGEVSWLMIITTIFTTIILLPLFAIKYVLYSEHLLISMGFYGQIRVRYEDIEKMTKTMNPLSSAAMSLKRLQIDYVEKGVHRMVLISPNGRERFIEEIEKRKRN